RRPLLATALEQPRGSGPDGRGSVRRGRVSHRRRRRALAPDKQGPALARAAGRGARGRPLRSPHRDEPVTAGHALHAEALARDAQRRRRRLLAEGERQPAFRLRLPDRRAPARARDGLRGADQERLRARPAGRRLRVYRSRTGGNEWEALTNGLPQEHCYVNVLRDAMDVDDLDPGGVYFGTTGGQVYGSADGGDSWTAIVRDLPAGLSGEAQTPP